ncbi:PhzF family phenazine biosynthesis isomerase [Marinactinospora rubrisoli]|uniref:PhzF family phenazine biosynthesis isomerase n=1 Tax=Marinactinospora rubrisoli TaxID=2715399 RepID=A0ABW2KDH4_9ACTN
MDVQRFAAFSDAPGGGNPAGVVLDAAGRTDAEMLAVATEVGYSETAFITGRDEHTGAYRVRYFSPAAEVAFCGHATVATAVALAERDGPGGLVFDTNAGAVPVQTTPTESGFAATLTSVATRSRPTDGAELDAALAALHWDHADLDPAFPPHVAFAGNDHLVLAAATRSRLADLDYDFAALRTLMERVGWTTVHLFWRESRGVVHARDPFPIGGVVEDPATGAAAAAFGGYLRALGVIDHPTRITVHQGADMGRPSRLLVEVDPADARVRVTGSAVRID